jgi:hypothetical protein
MHILDKYGAIVEVFDDNSGQVVGGQVGSAGAAQATTQKPMNTQPTHPIRPTGPANQLGTEASDPNQIVPITLAGWTVIVKTLGDLQQRVARLEGFVLPS